MQRPVGGSEDPLADVFEATVDELYRYASRLAGADAMLAEDVVQDAYLAFRRQIDSGPAVESPIAWLKRVVRNRFLDLMRSRERERQRLKVVAAETAQLLSDESSDVGLLDALPSDQRVALVLRYVDGCTVAEIATALGRSVHATESLLARGRANVRSKMREGR